MTHALETFAMSEGSSRDCRREPLRVGLILNTFPELSETFLIHLIAALLDGGHEVLIFASPSRVKPIHETVNAYDMMERARYLDVPALGPRMLVHGMRCLFGSTWDPGALACLNALRYGTGTLRFRALSSLREFRRESFDLLHCHYAAIGWSYLPYRRIFNVPFVTSFHGDHYKSFRYGQRWHLTRLFQQGDAFIANGEFTKIELARIGCPAAKIHVIPAVVSDDNVEFRPRTGGISGADGRISIVCVARLVISKGILVALEALKLLRLDGHNATLTLVGDGVDREHIRSRCAAMGLSDAVTFRGWLTQNEVYAVYRRADVAILPSIGDSTGSNESQGVVLQEAMLHGLPVIGSDLGGIPESLDHGAGGALFPPGDAHALARLVVEAAEKPAVTLKRVHHAYRYVRSKYLKPAVLRAHERVYDEALLRYAGRAAPASQASLTR
jgi:colanic acid/amylovoran biosynthesis glycosyltransferase